VGQPRGRLQTSLKLLNIGTTNGDGRRRRKRFSVVAIQKEVLVSSKTNLMVQSPISRVPRLFSQGKEARV